MASNNKIAIIIEHLALKRGGKRILENVCATIPAGGNTVILGPNGAGKTNMLLCLLGELTYDGQIFYVAEDNTSKVKKPRLAIVPQQVFIDPTMPLTVGEFISLGQKRPLWLGLEKKNMEAIHDLLTILGANTLLQSRMGKLSGGELRRVLLVAALLRRPDVLLLDEAEAGVDIKGEQMLWQALDVARAQYGFTQIMISHSLALAAHHASHVICLNRTVLAQGSPRNVLTANLLMRLYGIPIHLYPDQCSIVPESCPSCGAVDTPDHQLSSPTSNQPYITQPSSNCDKLNA